MGKTRWRRHESPSQSAKRGPHNKVEEDAPRPALKTTKQLRRKQRTNLRREWY